MVISELGVTKETWKEAISTFQRTYHSIPENYVPTTAQLFQGATGTHTHTRTVCDVWCMLTCVHRSSTQAFAQVSWIEAFL